MTIGGFDEEQTGEELEWNQKNDETVESTCKHCSGQRLNKTALSVYFREQSIADLAALSV